MQASGWWNALLLLPPLLGLGIWVWLSPRTRLLRRHFRLPVVGESRLVRRRISGRISIPDYQAAMARQARRHGTTQPPAVVRLRPKGNDVGR